MNILILGSGGREHSLAWAIKQNPKCDRLIIAPGNPGTAKIGENAALDIHDGGTVAVFAEANAIDLVVVGPEAPLAAGVADRLREVGITVFGPSKAAAELEASKAFTKEICDAAKVPTAAWARFSDAKKAHEYIDEMGAPIVVKADGLAAGKGVVVAMEADQAHGAVDRLLAAPGANIVIEEFMTGEEASFFVLADGEDVLAMGTAQDHKRIGEGDTGPNTGGMGAYSPAPVMSEAVIARTLDEIVRPTLTEMVRRGAPYQGVLYVGLMIEDGAPRLVEYNVRFGDPECQVLMMRLGAQVLDAIQAAAEGRLGEARIDWADDHAMTVVMAAPGYPGQAKTGTVLGGLDQLAEDSHRMVFHAGTAEVDGKLTSVGGRVLNVTARGASLRAAAERAYGMIDEINFPGAQVRRDIGWRALDET